MLQQRPVVISSRKEDYRGKGHKLYFTFNYKTSF